MDLGIKEKKALITGIGRGFGKSIAECLAREGCELILTSRTESDLQAFSRNIPALYCLADLSSQQG